MKITRTVRWSRNVLPVVAVLALAVLPAAAADQTQDSAPAAADGSVVADGTITAAPDVADTGSSAAADAGAATSQAASTGVDGAATSSARTTSTSAQSAAVAVPSDEFGSTEARKTQRRCGADPDPHYQPSDGHDSNQCYSNGKFRPNQKYTATHYTNDVKCDGENNIPIASGSRMLVYVTAGADGGDVAVCHDGTIVPVQGRAIARVDAGGSLQVVFDGDRHNPEETTQNWASATVSSGGVDYRCGESYDDGGRGTADAPTPQDNEEQCSP